VDKAHLFRRMLRERIDRDEKAVKGRSAVA
jgi:hypothetical protein